MSSGANFLFHPFTRPQSALVRCEVRSRERGLPTSNTSGPSQCEQATVFCVRSRRASKVGTYRPVSYTHLTLPTICSV
eukprot:355807-Prymnesium_polylepis.2